MKKQILISIIILSFLTTPLQVAGQDALKKPHVKEIFLANPAASPSGASAKAALQKAGVWDELQGKLVSLHGLDHCFQKAHPFLVDANGLSGPKY